MEILDKKTDTYIYINIDNYINNIKVSYDIFGLENNNSSVKRNIGSPEQMYDNFYDIFHFDYSKKYQFVNFDHFDNEIDSYVSFKRPYNSKGVVTGEENEHIFKNIIADPNKVDLYYVYYYIGFFEITKLFSSYHLPFPYLSENLQLHLDDRIMADLRSGKAKIILDHSIEGVYNIHIDKLGELFSRYDIDPKNVIWISGDVSLEKNAKGSILGNKSFVYYERHISRCIQGEINEKLNLIFEKKKEKIKKYAIDSNSMFTLWLRRPREGRFSMIYFLKKHNMLNYIAWGLYPSLNFYEYFKSMQQNYKKQGYYIDDRINTINRNPTEIPLHTYRELLSYEIMVDIYSKFFWDYLGWAILQADVQSLHNLHDLPDKQKEDLFFVLTLSDKSTGKANQNPHYIYEGGSADTFEYKDIENSLIQIVVETYTETKVQHGLGPKLASYEKRIWLSEKSFKPFATNMLPIYAAEQHTVKHLRSMGYDLYDDLINHDYDEEENDLSRLERVVLECKRLSNKKEEICDFITNNWNRIESNNRHLKNCIYRGGVI